MKNLNSFVALGLTLLISLLLFLSACKGRGDRTLAFIPGTYVSYARGDFSMAWDTMVIRELDDHNGMYSILRKTAFQRIREGKLMPAEHDSEQWEAVYRPGHQILEVPGRGKIISLFADSGRITVGHKEYHKLND